MPEKSVSSHLFLSRRSLPVITATSAHHVSRKATLVRYAVSPSAPPTPPLQAARTIVPGRMKRRLLAQAALSKK